MSLKGMSLEGRLALFHLSGENAGTRPYFSTADVNSSRALVFIGGLYNGLLEPYYIPALAGALKQAGWKLVMFAWSGQYDGYGTGSLDRDVSEMSTLIKHIRENDDVKDVVIMGHSTGSQDVIHYLTSPDYSSREPVLGGIMQAPASDRQYFAEKSSEGVDDWKKALKEAEELLKQGKGETLLSEEFCKKAACRMNAYRLHSLIGIGGDDDYFSSDLPDSNDPPTPHVHPLSESFGKLPTPALALWSGADECGYLEDQQPLLDRWEAASKGKLTTKIVPGAGHGVKEESAQKALCEITLTWLKEQFAK